MRTDDNNNPTAFTVDLAKQAGLVLGVDYESGTPFPAPSKLVTAKILGDPIVVTIKLINAVGFYTQHGGPKFSRWDYINMPKFVWDSLGVAAIHGSLSSAQRDVIGFMYQCEGGIAMRHLFPNYGI